jgi:opacity protein-like surface antigen
MKNRVRGAALAATAALATAIVINAGAGLAADLAVKAPKALYNWTGCYVGGYVGYGAGNDWRSTDLTGLHPANVNPWDFSIGNEAIGGGTLGCNWQASSWLVLGVEGEAGFLHINGGAPQPLITPPPGGGFSSVLGSGTFGTGYGLIAGRAGVAFDRLLVYGKVGVAFYDSAATITDSNIPGFVATGSKSQSPFAIGGGVQYAMWDHWLGNVEYVHFDRGSSFNACGGGLCWKQDPSPVHTFKIGLDYKFW